MHRYLVDVENGLLVNQKFRHGAKNRAIQHELNAKRIASKQLKRHQSDRLLLIDKKKTLDDQYERIEGAFKKEAIVRGVDIEKKTEIAEELNVRYYELENELQVANNWFKQKQIATETEEHDKEATAQRDRIKDIVEHNEKVRQAESINRYKIAELLSVPCDKRKQSSLPAMKKEM